MGQKVHPLGFRVGITKKHQSQWFARFDKNSYAQSVVEDRMLRNTLIKLFPELLNPVFKKIQNRQQETSVTPKITQIKIERGLIPYEIGIQIHAQNCDLIKSAIDKLKIDRDLSCYLQRAQKFLVHIGQKAKSELDDISQKSGFLNTQSESEKDNGIDLGHFSGKAKKKVLKRVKIRSNLSSFSFLSNKRTKVFQKSRTRGPKLTKQQFKRKKLIQKRLKKRQSIRFRFYEFIAKGLFIKKYSRAVTSHDAKSKETSSLMKKELNTGLLFIQRKIKSKRKNLNRFNKKSQQRSQAQNRKLPLKPSITGLEKQNLSGFALRTELLRVQSIPNQIQEKQLKGSRSLAASKSNLKMKTKSHVFIRIQKKIQKKFLSIYLTKMNKNFLIELKKMMKYCAEFSNNKESENSYKYIPFGYSVKWELNKLNSFKNQPIAKLMKLVQVLEGKIAKKMEALKKYFIIFGNLSKMQAYGFYQIIMFLKSLKALIRQRFTRLKLGASYTGLKKEEMPKMRLNSAKTSIKSKSSLNQSNIKTKKVLFKIVNNLKDECRKIKFIEYLKQMVKNHRTNNIFYYLSTLAKANKDLNRTKNFTIKNAQFLFGFDLKNSKNSPEVSFIKDRVRKVLEQSTQNTMYNGNQDFEQALRESLINQIEKQKFISKENLKLTPKISIKFYSVKKQNLEIKASVIGDSIVDSLEKRKAFRKVIKDAKENLMKKQRVKGVKIQVAGRLNGAEIARTEWVRAGRVPLQTLRANIDFSYKTANTIYGIIGVKVWIFKGYTKTI